VRTDADAAAIQMSGLWTAGSKWSLKASLDAQVSQSYTTAGIMLSGEWNAAPRWSVKASMDTNLSSIEGASGGRVSVRHAW
jgi:hypothetical protein